MELSPASHVVLGMLHIGARSGYEIKSAIERSARFFWTLSPVQIYPELKRLEEADLISGRDGSSGGRRRRLYTLTAKGKRALRDWLRSQSEPTMEWRDSGLVKMYLADALEPEEALGTIRAIRQRSERLGDHFRTELVPAAEVKAEERDYRYPLLTAQFGLDFHEWVVEWCSQRERELAPAATSLDSPEQTTE